MIKSDIPVRKYVGCEHVDTVMDDHRICEESPEIEKLLDHANKLLFDLIYERLNRIK